MASCPKGHESGTLDYCDVCGARMGDGTASPAAASAVPPPLPATPAAVAPSAAAPDARVCPVCGTTQTGRFCEEDGYDFLLSPPVADPARASSAASTPSTTEPTPSETAPSEPAPSEPAPSGSTPPRWTVTVHPDSAYFEVVRAMGGEDASAMAFPQFAPERRFELTGQQMVIGRRSRSRGINPDIDLAGPPEDPGVSHVHALLVAQEDGWAVVDLESANGTYLNDPSSNPIDPNVPVPVNDGDTIYLGAWTALTIHAP
ncbi:FHA domain-containing protein [Micromonospora sp. NPDC006766]|uniref:FHA domain-containing protein n=1 Tax=Micromonospora sp. NPDC006766 TaxID=3154778 RepID=UPI0033E09DF2